MSLSKTLYPLLSTRSTQKDPSNMTEKLLTGTQKIKNKNKNTFKHLVFEFTAPISINPLCTVTENPLMGTFTNSKDPDEMQHNPAFHQDLHCL